MSRRKVKHLTVVMVVWLFKGLYGDFTIGKVPQLRFHDFEPRQLNTLALDGVNGSASMRRSPRGFHFHAEKADIHIDIEFVVPLVRVPLGVNRSLSLGAFRNLVNLNTAALVQTGIFVVIGALIAMLVKLFSTPITLPENYAYKKASRQTETAIKYENDNYLVRFVERKLLENNIDLPVCLQRSICDFVRKSNVAVAKGTATSMDAMVEALTCIDPLRDSIRGSALQEAIEFAQRNSSSCHQVYDACKWQLTDNKAFKFLMNYGKYFIK